MIQESLLHQWTPHRVTPDFACSRENPVAGYENRNRIAGDGRPDCPGGSGMSYRCSYPSIAPSLTARDLGDST